MSNRCLLDAWANDDPPQGRHVPCPCLACVALRLLLFGGVRPDCWTMRGHRSAMSVFLSSTPKFLPPHNLSYKPIYLLQKISPCFYFSCPFLFSLCFLLCFQVLRIRTIVPRLFFAACCEEDGSVDVFRVHGRAQIPKPSSEPVLARAMQSVRQGQRRESAGVRRAEKGLRASQSGHRRLGFAVLGGWWLLRGSGSGSVLDSPAVRFYNERSRSSDWWDVFLFLPFSKKKLVKCDRRWMSMIRLEGRIFCNLNFPSCSWFIISLLLAKQNAINGVWRSLWSNVRVWILMLHLITILDFNYFYRMRSRYTM